MMTKTALPHPPHLVTLSPCHLVTLSLCLLAAGCPGKPPPAAATRKAGPAEDALEQARETLTRASDVTTCRTALQQLNLHLGRNPERRPAALEVKQRELLQDPAGFNLN